MATIVSVDVAKTGEGMSSCITLQYRLTLPMLSS